MARPFKTGVDYLPLDVFPKDKIKLLEAKHKLIGFGVWVKLLQKIYSNSYWLEWTNDISLLFSNEINVEINVVNDIINSCLCWNIFNKCMYEEYSVLTSTGIQKRYFDITRRRNRIEIIEELLLVDVNPAPKQEIINVNINSIISNRSTQSKVKESKVKESKVKESKVKESKVKESKVKESKVKESKVKESKEYTPIFLNLWKDCPNSGDAKKQTFKNYIKTIKIYSWSEEQIYHACMNYYKIQKGNKNEFPYKLSNLVGEKYREILPDYLNKSITNETFTMEINGEELA
jgi:hypothetical protein